MISIFVSDINLSNNLYLTLRKVISCVHMLFIDYHPFLFGFSGTRESLLEPYIFKLFENYSSNKYTNLLGTLFLDYTYFPCLSLLYHHDVILCPYLYLPFYIICFMQCSLIILTVDFIAYFN